MATLDCWQALWRALKAVIRVLTRRGELERLLTAGDYSPGMGRAVGDAFRRSRQLQGIVSDMASDDTAEDTAFATRIVTLKRISFAEPTFNARTLPNLLACIRAFRGSKAAAAAGAKLAAVKYDAENAHHEALLLALWRVMRPGMELTARKSKQWTDLGFQGTDPASDFRGMGLLGLYQLLHLARCHAEHVGDVIRKTDLPFKGYPLALLSITMTQWALEEARGAALDAALSASLAVSAAAATPSSRAGAPSHVDAEAAGAGGAASTAASLVAAPVQLSVATGGAVSDSSAPALAALHDVIARLTLLFDAHWYASAPRSMMEFPDVFASFKRRVQHDMAANGGLLPHQPPPPVADDRGVAPVDARAGAQPTPRSRLPPGLAYVPSGALTSTSTSASSSFASAAADAGGRTAVRQVFVQQRRGASAASDSGSARDDDDADDADDGDAAARPLKGGR